MDELGLTSPYAVSRRCGVAHDTVRLMLTGRRATSEATLQKLADGLGLPVQALRAAAGRPSGERRPFVLPPEAQQLDQHQREVVLAMIRALLQASGRSPNGSVEVAHNATLRAVPPLAGRLRDPFSPAD
jgi:hypothetical protein